MVNFFQLKISFFSFLLFLFLFSYFYFSSYGETPPDGYRFEREPEIQGIYQLEKLGNKIYKSSVGGVQVWCTSYSYYANTWIPNGSQFDCGREALIHGKWVKVERVKLPRKEIGAPPIVVKIEINGENIFNRSDKEIRDLWIYSTKLSSAMGAFLLALVVHLSCIFLNFYFFHRN